MIRRLHFIFAIFLSLLAAPVALALKVEKVTVVTASGATEFQAEIAETASQRRTGLMFRKHLAPDRAMLFDFHSAGAVSIWMKNTYIPLDIIFVEADGTVAGVRRGKPHSTDILSVDAPVRGVLEVAAGTAERIGLAKGDRVKHRIFENP